MSSKKQPKPSNIAEFKTGVLKGLTFKQRKFAEFYVIEGNKTKAAIRAGYSANSASWQGTELTRNAEVIAYIQFLLGEQDKEIMASVEEAKRRMTLGFRGELKEEVVVMQTTTTRTKGKTVTKTKPVIIKKAISIRDSIEATKLYVDLLGIDKTEVEGTKPASTDDKILAALNDRKVNVDVPEGVVYEEDKDDASNQDAKAAEAAQQ